MKMRLARFHIHVCLHVHLLRVRMGEEGIASFMNHNQFAEDVGI